MASAGPPNPEQVGAKVKTLINKQLQQILKKEGLTVSGAKAALQTRIINREFLVSIVIRSGGTLSLQPKFQHFKMTSLTSKLLCGEVIS